MQRKSGADHQLTLAMNAMNKRYPNLTPFFCVRRLEAGGVAPAIKVDGNHRYVAGRLVGKEPAQTPGKLSRSQADKVKPVQDLKIDASDWGNR